MAFQLAPFTDIDLGPDALALLLEEHRRTSLPRLERFWAYYRAETTAAQRSALPPRLRAERTGDDDRAGKPEVVIENDIGWRIDAVVDFVAGKPVRLLSTARSESTRRDIERILDAVWESSGGIALIQDMVLLGAVHGHIDLILRAEPLFESPAPSGSLDSIVEAATRARIEPVEAPRAIPVLNPGDFRDLRALVIHAEQRSIAPARRTGLRRFFPGPADRRSSEVIEIISASARQVYLDGALAFDAPNPLGALPVVHIQNTSQPFRYEGISDVEPLIRVQDELNTRLSDRAHRVTLQSFQMYLAKGIDGFGEGGVAPGMVWATDNPDAAIDAFGGDMHAPSEDRHIDELRDALDKMSGVSPVVLGVIRERIGNLTSENALRVTLMGILAKTARKRGAYGRGIARMSRLVLDALDASGIYPTDPLDRDVRLEWDDPLTLDERDRLRAAQLKVDLGVERQRVLAELGYAPQDGGVT